MMAANAVHRLSWSYFNHCGRKRFYATRTESDREVNRMNKEHYPESYESYRCRHCGGFHVGHAR